MRTFNRLGLAVVCAAAFSIGVARASVVTTITQDGANVDVTAFGTLNLTALTLVGSTTVNAGIFPSAGTIVTGPAGNVDLYTGNSFTGPSSFGSGGVIAPVSGGTGNTLGVEGQFPAGLIVPAGYKSFASLFSTLVFDNATIALLGLTPGTYTWTWGSGVAADSLTLNIAQTPIPTALPLFATGLGALSLLGWRRKRKAAATIAA